MNEQQLATFFMVFLGLVIGAITGGGSVIIVYGRAMKAILNSPVLIRSLEVAAESWPAPVREAVADTGRFLQEVGDGTQTVTTTTPGGATVTTTQNTAPAEKAIPVPAVPLPRTDEQSLSAELAQG